MSQKKQGFVYGALILMLANIIVKAAGALFKIPLSNIIGDTAMGYFNTAYSIYSMCFLISTAGLPVAISRMIAQSLAKGRTNEVSALYRVSLLIFSLIGIFGSALLFFGAEALSAIPGEPELKLCLMAISPIMFFICLVACMRGYFQGHQNMIPTAISQILEALGKLLLGLTAGIIASRNGYAPEAVAAFGLGGITLGVVLSAFYLSFSKWIWERKKAQMLSGESEPKRSLAKRLIRIAIPITVSSSILSMTSVMDSMLATRLLNSNCIDVSYFAASDGVPVAVTLCGAYMAKAVTLFNLPPTLIYPFAISLIPAISSSKEAKDEETAKKTVHFAFRIVSVICLPAAFGLGIMAKPIIDLLFTSNEIIFLDPLGTAHYSNAVSASMLTVLSPAIVFSGLISVSGAMLQACGHENKSIFSTCFGVAAKGIFTLILVGNPKIGLYGIPISTLICYLIMFAFNLYFLSKYTGYFPRFGKILLRPFFAAFLCGCSAIGFYLPLMRFLPQEMATILGIFGAGIVYLFSLFKLKGFEKEDVLMLPKGKKLVRILQFFRLIA